MKVQYLFPLHRLVWPVVLYTRIPNAALAEIKLCDLRVSPGLSCQQCVVLSQISGYLIHYPLLDLFILYIILLRG